MSDVQPESIYGDLKSAQFAGIPSKDGKNASIRSTYKLLTRLAESSMTATGKPLSPQPGVRSGTWTQAEL